MGYCERHVVSITSIADGSGTGYTPVVTGKVISIRYVKTDYDNTADITITAEATGESILAVTDQAASATYTPRAATMSTAGAAALYAAGGAAVNDHIRVVNDRIKIVIAQAGNVKTGAFHVVVE